MYLSVKLHIACKKISQKYMLDRYESEDILMKKIITGIICAALLFTFAACESKPAADSAHVDGSLSEIFAKIYDNADVGATIGTLEVAVDDTNKGSMLGSTDVKFTEGLASEALIMTIPHSMVLIRVDEGTDIEATKKLIKDNVDPRKWICVGVDPEDVIVDNIGNLIFLVMSADAQAYHDSFLKLAE